MMNDDYERQRQRQRWKLCMSSFGMKNTFGNYLLRPKTIELANRRSNTSNRKPTSGSLFNNIHVLVLKIEQWNCRLQLLAPQRAANINARRRNASSNKTNHIPSHPIDRGNWMSGGLSGLLVPVNWCGARSWWWYLWYTASLLITYSSCQGINANKTS